MKSREEYLSELKEIVDKYYIENKLINKIKKEFIKKHLNQRIPNQIFSSLMDSKDLNVNEMICISRMCYEFGIESMNPKIFFSDVELSAYESFITIEEDINEIVLHNVNVNPLNPMSFVSTYTPLKVVHDLYKYRLVGYDFNQQREAKIIQIGSKNTKVRVQNINRNSVDDMRVMMGKNKYQPTTITINITLKEDKEPNIDYDENTKTLRIKPNLDIESDNWCSPVIIDGQHRLLAAYECISEAIKNNTLDKIKGSLHISVQCWTVEEAREFILTEQKANSFDSSYVKSLESDDSMKAAEMLESEGNADENYLYNNVAETWSQMRALDKVTERVVIANALKTIKDFDLGSYYHKKHKMPKIIKCLQLTSEYVTFTKYDGNYDVFKKSVYCEPYAWALYIMISGEMIKYNKYLEEFETVLEKLINMEAEMIALNLGNKNCSMNKLKKFVDNIILNYELKEVSVSE